ncbi:N-acetyltransferase [Peptoniphilus sp. MSJ-1]|uniref:N-acetyltransferase n=1 Tax=Peptoniphilus ovalis TaxID=2841503 RepID=A0ABS6FF89_9FIRM|nr:N-acetyltransferase [Peptoniphilus ovalis]MBU5668621.1 N-acetyltransferase [Peptoniphilus ovalis]
MKIRREEEKDYKEIDKVVEEAFNSAEHADGNEKDLVIALRNGISYIPELALVAEENGKIIGHVMFTKAEVGDETVLALAPISVLPDAQRKKVGSALIKEAHKIARELGYNYSVVLGSEKYYPKFGYKKAIEFGITSPFDVPEKNFMAIKLTDDANKIKGKMKYAKEFGIE